MNHNITQYSTTAIATNFLGFITTVPDYTQWQARYYSNNTEIEVSMPIFDEHNYRRFIFDELETPEAMNRALKHIGFSETQDKKKLYNKATKGYWDMAGESFNNYMADFSGKETMSKWQYLKLLLKMDNEDRKQGKNLAERVSVKEFTFYDIFIRENITKYQLIIPAIHNHDCKRYAVGDI